MDEDRRTCRVCIAGGGGYIGSWLIRDLLLKGYYVNATFRDPGLVSLYYLILIGCLVRNLTLTDSAGNENKTRHILSLPAARERLTLFKSDINEPGSFDSAVHGCDFVIHMATPMDYTKDPEVKNYLGFPSQLCSYEFFTFSFSLFASDWCYPSCG